MQTFRNDFDKDLRFYFKCKPNVDEFAIHKKMRADFQAAGATELSYEPDIEGNSAEYEYNNMKFTLIFDEMMGSFVHCENPDMLDKIEEWINGL